MPNLNVLESNVSEMDSPAGPVPGRTAVPLDDTDRQILARLLKDARQSVRALAEQVHISRANAYTRVGRLLAEGVITGFTAQLNPKRAGLGTSAYITLSTEQAAWRDISRELREIPYVEHVSLVSGDFDVLVLVRAPDNEALRSVVLESIQGVPGVRSTRTWLVFDEVRGRGADWTG
ncbi:Lrp/AsnC family transcriptional regulator [Streptomyces ossamyceticus]|jgi:DNA-binding Lrp family transcriptional regulator|uniref:Lrp/AsnC family transcriptional regulator n=2 Tax=Streptomyces TaxID=1883 RepID=A0ABV2V9E4_9ACTN|nr:Lrp/AsnC family transcriptional regulator [Streptomyces ossamyceticus]